MELDVDGMFFDTDELELISSTLGEYVDRIDPDDVDVRKIIDEIGRYLEDPGGCLGMPDWN